MVVKNLISCKIIISLSILIAAVLYREKLTLYFNWLIRENEDKVGLLTEHKLAQYNGITQDKLYLAVLGTVFDVTEGKRHYQKGGSYHYFIGKDGSRSFVTGNFKDESEEKDHIMDLSCSELFSLFHWKSTFRKKYTEVGKLIGRYYTNNGEDTVYSKELKNKMRQCEIEKDNAKKEDLKYPPCNMAWSEDEGTKVWCTTSSGGIKRSWTGVPRQLYSPGVEKPRCICLNLDENENASGLIKKYNNCPYKSTTCVVKT